MAETTFPNDLWFDLETLICTAEPASVAVFGNVPTQFVETYAEQRALLQRPFQLHQVPPEQAHAFDQPVDVAILIDTLEKLDHYHGLLLISRLRDVISKQFCVCLPLSRPDGEGWSLNQMLGLGLRRVSRYPIDSGEYALFSYSLKDYKTTPDWLNADNWANPEMWGKYWW